MRDHVRLLILGVIPYYMDTRYWRMTPLRKLLAALIITCSMLSTVAILGFVTINSLNILFNLAIDLTLTNIICVAMPIGIVINIIQEVSFFRMLRDVEDLMHG